MLNICTYNGTIDTNEKILFRPIRQLCSIKITNNNLCSWIFFARKYSSTFVLLIAPVFKCHWNKWTRSCRNINAQLVKNQLYIIGLKMMILSCLFKTATWTLLECFQSAQLGQENGSCCQWRKKLIWLFCFACP